MKKKPRLSILWSTPRLRAASSIFVIGILVSIPAAFVTSNYTALICIATLGPILILTLQKTESATKAILRNMSSMSLDVVTSQETTNNLSRRFKLLGRDIQELGNRIDITSSQSGDAQKVDRAGSLSIDAEELLEILDVIMRTAEASGNTIRSDLSPAQEASLQILIENIEPKLVLPINLTTYTRFEYDSDCILTLDHLGDNDFVVPPGTCIVLGSDDFQELQETVINWSRFEDTMFVVATRDKQTEAIPPRGFVETYPNTITYGLRIFYPMSRVQSVNASEEIR